MLRSLCVLAGDISPLDVISHIPVLCEDSGIPYVYVAAKAGLGEAAATKRPTSVVLVASKRAKGKGEQAAFDAQDKLDECVEEIKDLIKA